MKSDRVDQIYMNAGCHCSILMYFVLTNWTLIICLCFICVTDSLLFDSFYVQMGSYLQMIAYCLPKFTDDSFNHLLFAH